MGCNPPPHRSKMNHISATIITKNEEANIERCLNSLNGIADEIIVVDSGSTDATVDICRRYGCHITERKFDGYGSQRQYASSLASHTFVLAIDADEVLSDELRQSILRIKSTGLDHRVYSFAVAEYYWGTEARHCAIDARPKIRLFNKRYAQWNLMDLGEKVTFSEALRPCLLEGKLLHYRANTIEEFRAKESLRARLNGAAIAARQDRIGTMAPSMAWIRTYLRMMVKRGAMYDGRTGRIIARVVADSAKEAQVIARRLIVNELQENEN